MIELVIFDMDGLLIDTEIHWQKTEREVLEGHGIHITPEMQKATFGLRCDEQISYWYKYKPWPNPDFKKDEEEYNSIMHSFFMNEAELMPGVEYILNFFKKKDIPIGLASSSDMFLINAFVERFNLKDYFLILHSAEFEEFGKPHPAVYINTAKKVNKNPIHCLAFEDSLNGLIAAKAARMKAVIVPDHRTHKGEKYDIADLQINSLSDFGEKEYKFFLSIT